MSKVCDTCGDSILEEQTFYHCTVCRLGDFDICERCYSEDKRCGDEHHFLLHHRIRGDTVVDANTGNLIHYFTLGNCPGCIWEKNGKLRDDDTPFHYEPFPNESYIRVIDLFPGPDDEPLRYSLHYTRLDSLSGAQYIAVSYVCGDVSVKVPSYCNGKRLDIYATLDKALRKWRRIEKQNWLRIWADAISIRQDDNQEKSAQVANMHEIYRHANQVFVDLGDPPEGLDVAVELIRGASKSFRDANKTQMQPDKLEPGPIHSQRLPKTEVTVDQALALTRFSELAWFRRLWVVQEVCLWDVHKAFPPVFLCGDHRIEWIDLINASTRFGVAPLQIIDDPAVVIPELRGAYIEGTGWNPVAVAIFLEYYKIQSKQGPAQNLHWFLQRSWKQESTNPADKVYGLLGLVKGQYAVIHSRIPTAKMQQNVRKLDGKREIRVDYDLPLPEIYEAIARLTLAEENSLNMLADAGSGKSRKQPHLPSWIPDWSSYPKEPALIISFGLASTANYRASLETKPVLPTEFASGLLEVDAYFADRVLIEAARSAGETDVIEVSGAIALPEHRIIGVKHYILSLWWCFGVKFNTYPTGQRPFDVFWRTLIANRVISGKQLVVPSAAFAESFLLAYPEILEVEIKDEKPACICPEWAITDHQNQVTSGRSEDCKNDGCREEKITPIRDRYPRPGEFFGNEQPAYGEHFNEALRLSTIGRKFFRTRKGYMGIGPKNLTRGDHIVILKGGSLPFVLRKANAGEVDGKPIFTLLGEAYVHGLSEGEIFQDCKDPQNDPNWTRVILN
ncbi:hypothetical protein AYL99_05590 [Fonsecaea erecta]|uniref:Heterokaryon incompatibility domain-containing protein n=1 Tax=Fonsecaea erecta TaxID=1367422 RepID=A0A178ZLB0_9EURO|nr:hypothetical protein AYL99_05590 [Fonsecaea erecta]OAP60588.1 hypothetical protein AYL99_05590 [Fonsecaea erecta]